VDRSQLERVGGRLTMQYRGTSLPLVALGDRATVGDFAEDQELAVIVFTARGREVGLLGAQPVDSAEVDVPVDQHTHRQPGISGSMIIHDRTTLIIDIHELIGEAVQVEMAADLPSAAEAVAGATILLAEDSAFFRNQVKKFLESDGFTVIAAEDGALAWKKLLEHESVIKAVVSDIEMPNMTGFELVERIRGEERFACLPVIAVTSLAGEDDILRGKGAGFSDYQVKLDKERLLGSLHALLAQNA